MSAPRPCSATEAVWRALSLVDNGGQYVLGTGDYLGENLPPWTSRGPLIGSDCAGFAMSWCYKLPRHRNGYNVGSWATVSDDINCNSGIEDARHTRDLFELVAGSPRPGDLLTYPTFTVSGKQFIGHVGIVTGTSHVLEWDALHPQYDLLDIAQSCGPSGRKPGVIATDGSIWSHHDSVWPRPGHRVVILRARP